MPLTTIDAMFARCRAENRAALILYITAGFPDADTTRRLLPVLAESGCDLIEVGVPFSDPIADGPVIQRASTEALSAGASFAGTLELARGFRAAGHATPIVLFGAYNPFFTRGLEKAAAEATAAGVDGFLAADLPVEECGDLLAACERYDLGMTLLIAPTSPPGRMARIGKACRGFVYAISLKGITGARTAVGGAVAPYLDAIRAETDTPIVVGFGISEPAHVAAVAPHADGVVVGSALVQLIEKCRRENLPLEETVRQFVRSLAARLAR